jgi:X-Pro dipeptidyl-peptidase
MAGLSSVLPAVAAVPTTPQIVVEGRETQPVFSHEHAIREVVYVEAPMDSDSDGNRDRIAVNVIRPAETVVGLKVPTIMEASPYFGRAGSPPPDQTRGFAGWWDDFFVPRGYAIAQVEMQGTARSFGCATTGGREDTISIRAVIDWLNGRALAYYHDGSKAVADWSTGNVGMQGVSYVGTLPNAVATEGIPGLRTIVPIAAISNWYRYANDQGIGWATWGSRYTEWLANYVSFGRSLPGSVSSSRCGSVISALGDREQASSFNFTPFWQERSYLSSINKIKTTKTSVFMVHGLTDYNVKTTHFSDMWYEVARRQMPRKVWVHRGAHISPEGIHSSPFEWQRVMHRWMDHWLHGIDNGIMQEPMADIQRPDGSWERHASWPDPRAAEVRLRFGPGSAGLSGTLSPTAPRGDRRQRFVDQPETQNIKIGSPGAPRTGRLVYVTPPLTRDLRISGTPRLRVRMSTTASSALLSALLVDYGAGETLATSGLAPLELIEVSCEPEDLAGRTGCAQPGEVSVSISPQRVLAWGHVDAKNHADLRFDQTLDPGEHYNVSWDLLPAEHVVPAGHRLGVVITGNYHASPHELTPTRDHTAIGSEITLDLNGSSLTLPVVGGPGALGF